MLKFLLSIAVMAGLAFGVVHFFFRDSPFYAHMFPQQAVVHGADTPEQIAVKTLVGLEKQEESVVVDGSGLLKIYKQAVVRKFAAAAEEIDGKAIIPWKNYVSMEQDKTIRDVLTLLDKNGSGKIDRNEWRYDSADFGRIDGDDDDIVSQQEIWDVVKFDKARWFQNADKNKDNIINRAEFNAAYKGKEQDFARELDANKNNTLEEAELNNAVILFNRSPILP